MRLQSRIVDRPARRRAFTLVELLVVMGIISVLMSLLLPSLNKAKRQALAVACQSNLRQCGQFLIMYANDNNGVLFPNKRGTNVPIDQRWPVFVFRPPAPNPPILTCPADPDMGNEDDCPEEKHSYILNKHIVYDGIRYSKYGKLNPTEIVVMGEKKTRYHDYYMEWDAKNNRTDYERLVERQRHGKFRDSNHVYLDGHVGTELPPTFVGALDPWDIRPSNNVPGDYPDN